MSTSALFSVTLLLIFVTCSLCRYPETRYFLYNTGCPDELCLLNTDGTVPPDRWEAGGSIKVLIHGWNMNPKLDAIQMLEDRFITPLARDFVKYNPKLNVIVVDWTHLASTTLPGYPVAAENTLPAGIEIANYLILLKTNGAFDDWTNVHILGFSLGGHVSGVIGNKIQELTEGQKIGRITGLDPAGPLFIETPGFTLDMTKVLDSADAQFVDIMHTSMGTGHIKHDLTSGLFGSNLQAGHADFYPNGGHRHKHQCNPITDVIESCSHHMALVFYALSLRDPYKYLGCPCEDYKTYLRGQCNCDLTGNGQFLGEMTNTHAAGRYYLKIEDKFIKA